MESIVLSWPLLKNCNIFFKFCLNYVKISIFYFLCVNFYIFFTTVHSSVWRVKEMIFSYKFFQCIVFKKAIVSGVTVPRRYGLLNSSVQEVIFAVTIKKVS